MLGLSACATVETGHAIDPAAQARLKVGVTTIEEAKAWFGEPSQVRRHSNGEVGLIYVHVKSRINGFTGNGDSGSEGLAMEFGPDGKLERFQTTSGPTSVRAR
ncbi:hypothetical protein [Luteibacter sp.]|uniref:hypothetical protein n=1 Tax=Luteibacter sp. TaxID=1886636 RepID=UPI0025C0BA62|nr:hypothetical protein [Luteibacter sp.]